MGKSMSDILIIEDTESDVRLLKRTLQLAGVQNPLRLVSSGAAAFGHLEAAANANLPVPAIPAIVFIDLKLPDISGFDILTPLKATPAFAKTLRIVISQIDEIGTIKKAYSLGAHTFLAKPPAQEELEKLIRVYPDHWQLSQPAAVQLAARSAKAKPGDPRQTP